MIPFGDRIVGNGVRGCMRCNDLVYLGGKRMTLRNDDIERWNRSGHIYLCQSMNSLRLTIPTALLEADDAADDVDAVGASAPYLKF